MTCRCREEFSINGHNSPIFFRKDNFYEYRTERHEETGILLYYILKPKHKPTLGLRFVINDDEEFPFVENSFLHHFDNIQELREDKLNQILN